jgi:hypothetical protein
MVQPLALAMDELHTQIGNAVSCENPSSFCCCNSFHLIDGHDESNGQAVGVNGSRQLQGTKFIYKGKLISHYDGLFSISSHLLRVTNLRFTAIPPTVAFLSVSQSIVSPVAHDGFHRRKNSHCGNLRLCSYFLTYSRHGIPPWYGQAAWVDLPDDILSHSPRGRRIQNCQRQ